MRRSESVLVYGVTGVLAVILAVAIVFGGDPANAAGGEGSARVPDDLTDDRLDDDLSDGSVSEAEAAKPERERDLLEELLNESRGVDPNESVDELEAEGVSEGPAADKEPAVPVVPLSRVAATLGQHRTEENPASGVKFRFVQAQPGDSIALVIQRWCPGTDREVVAALNETKDLSRLMIGDEICVPWVDDDALLAAHEDRASGRVADVPVEASGGSTTVATPRSTEASTQQHTLAEGESLWVLASNKVGARKAQAYINRILALNPNIADPDRVRAGTKLTLPK